MTLRVRVVVQDRRRLIRDGVAERLGAEPDIEVVAVVADPTELPVDLGRLDVVLLGASDEPGAWRDVRVVRFTDDAAMGSLVGAVRATVTPGSHDHAVHETAGISKPRLTPREAEVTQRMAEGLSVGQIATTLGIAQKSVDNHKQRIFVKLGAHNGAHAVALALDAGLLGHAAEGGCGLAG